MLRLSLIIILRQMFRQADNDVIVNLLRGATIRTEFQRENPGCSTWFAFFLTWTSLGFCVKKFWLNFDNFCTWSTCEVAKADDIKSNRKLWLSHYCCYWPASIEVNKCMRHARLIISRCFNCQTQSKLNQNFSGVIFLNKQGSSLAMP